MEWLQDNSDLVSALATAMMTIAWVVYAQFGIFTYLRSRRPRVVIDKTADNSINTRFIVVNLSEAPIYISGILVVVQRGDSEIVRKIENYQRASTDDGEELDSLDYAESQLRHGTLNVGQLFMVGSSRETLSWLLEDDADDVDQDRQQRLRKALDEVDNVEFRVVAMAGNDDRPVAASREFDITFEHDQICIVPLHEYTRQYSSWWHRRIARDWAEQVRRR